MTIKDDADKGGEIPIIATVMVGEAPSAPSAPPITTATTTTQQQQQPQQVVTVQATAQPLVYTTTTQQQQQQQVPTPSPAPVNNNGPVSVTTTVTEIPAVPMQNVTATAAAPLHVVGGVTNMAGLGRDPKRIRCPICHQDSLTRTSNKIDVCTIIAIVVLLCFVPLLFWIPLICPSCKTTEHTCNQCNRIVGKTEACE